MSDVFVHIGLPKTGTTSIQLALKESAPELAAHGVELTGGRHRVQRLAVYDLLGRRIEGDEVHDVAGAWKHLVEQLDESAATTAVISEELLSASRPRQIRSLVKSLSAHRVFVVIGVRDFGRSIPSAWQQEVVKGHSFTWSEFAAAIRDPAEGPASAGVSFRLRFDLLRILDTWERVVPRERIRLVTVPPKGSPPELLLDRFGEVIGVPEGTLRGQAPTRNEALGAVEVEVLRRLNSVLRSELSPAQHIAVVQGALRAGLAGREGSRRLPLPQQELPWVSEWTEALVTELRQRGYEVHGDLKDLEPTAADPAERPLDDVTDAELLEPTEQALRALSLSHASLWKRHQRLRGRQEADASVATRLTSSARAASFGVRMSALDHADRNRFLGWLSRVYLRATSRR
jgi:hypothetical protein